MLYLLYVKQLDNGSKHEIHRYRLAIFVISAKQLQDFYAL